MKKREERIIQCARIIRRELQHFKTRAEKGDYEAIGKLITRIIMHTDTLVQHILDKNRHN